LSEAGPAIDYSLNSPMLIAEHHAFVGKVDSTPPGANIEAVCPGPGLDARTGRQLSGSESACGGTMDN
jgi:hypothetical protein